MENYTITVLYVLLLCVIVCERFTEKADVVDIIKDNAIYCFISNFIGHWVPPV